MECFSCVFHYSNNKTKKKKKIKVLPLHTMPLLLCGLASTLENDMIVNDVVFRNDRVLYVAWNISNDHAQSKFIVYALREMGKKSKDLM